MSIWPLVEKEFRALFPLWSASIAVIGLFALTSHDMLQALAIVAYAFGGLVLGAHAIGHEYSSRTLAILLVQPVDRRRLWITKVAVLAPLLVTMGAAAWYVFLGQFGEPQPGLAIVLLPVVGGLFVAPWLTMLIRNQLGGVMVTGIAAGWSMTATSLLTVTLSGLDAEQAEQFGVQIWTWLMYAFAAVSAVLGWRTFMGLEAIEGAGRDFQLPRWFRAAERARDSHPAWMLIRKELRLQQVTFVMAGFFVAGELSLRILETNGFLRSDGAVRDVLIPIYLAAVALVAGSLASAEERQSGMLESQLLLPMAARQQWIIKAGVAVGLALLLGIGPVAVLRYVGEPGEIARDLLSPFSIVLIMVMTASGLYVSSLSSSGVRALATAFPFLLGTFLLVEFIATRIPARDQAVIVTAFAFAALLLVFAGSNHRRTDRSFTRVLWQIGAAAVLIVGGLPFFTAIVDLTT